MADFRRDAELPGSAVSWPAAIAIAIAGAIALGVLVAMDRAPAACPPGTKAAIVGRGFTVCIAAPSVSVVDGGCENGTGCPVGTP